MEWGLDLNVDTDTLLSHVTLASQLLWVLALHLLNERVTEVEL